MASIFANGDTAIESDIAILLFAGASESNTMRKHITDVSPYKDSIELLNFGNVTALLRI
jgi:hypothetical protein